jgi:hypothetical protein
MIPWRMLVPHIGSRRMEWVNEVDVGGFPKCKRDEYSFAQSLS